jgi:UDP-N-acetylmuramate dehydrogenase
MVAGSDVVPRLRRILPPSQVLADEPMSRHTSFGIGGPADVLVMPANPAELRATLELVRRHGIPLLVMGRGTNLLVRDRGVRGVVIKLAAGFDDLRFAGNAVAAGAGLDLNRLCAACADQGLTGMEFAEGIPGTVGGAAVMNAGAYGGEMSRVVTSVELVRLDGTEERLEAAALDYSYRWSVLQDQSGIVTRVHLALAAGDRRAIEEQMSDLSERRRSRQPTDMPSAGSVFRRPPGQFAGPLVEGAGCKGMRVGGAMVSPKHAGFIVNTGGATAADVLTLVAGVREKVRERSGVELTMEIKVVGEP